MSFHPLTSFNGTETKKLVNISVHYPSTYPSINFYTTSPQNEWCWLTSVVCFFKYLFIFEREGDRAWVGRDREKGRHRIWSRLQALSCQHRARRWAWTHDCEIIIWAEVRYLTNWATQVPLVWFLFHRNQSSITWTNRTMAIGNAEAKAENNWIELRAYVLFFVFCFCFLEFFSWTTESRKLFERLFTTLLWMVLSSLIGEKLICSVQWMP